MPDHRLAPVHAVDRPALFELLDVGVRGPLTVIIAPAGSGKTVLLSQWTASRPDLAVAWFHATRADRDVTHFARRLAADLAAAHPAVAEVRPAAEATGGLGESYLEALVGALAEAGVEIVIVIDDVHVLLPELVDDLSNLADRLPPNAHLVLASRSDAGMRLTHHRLQHALVEIRQHQLTFADDETEDLLGRLTGSAVDLRTAATVRQHTDGWAAGVQLAGLTLRSRPGEDLVASLAESDRLIVDYLGEEVLDAQSPERREALLRLSVADELHPDLVAILTEADLGVDLLGRLERESMFLSALPEKPGWFAFHALFRKLMRMRLRAEHPGLERTLLVRVADWSRGRGDTATAVEALLRAQAWDDAMELVVTSGREVFERGYVATVARWLGTVPDDIRRTSVDAEIVYAITYGMTGRAREAAEFLRSVAARSDVDPGRRAVALAWLGVTVQFNPPAETAYEEAASAVALLLADPDLTLPDLLQLNRRDLLLAISLVAAGRAQLFLGNLDESQEWIERMLNSAGGQYTPYRIHALGSLAVADAFSGRLVRAAARADEALRLAEESALLDHPATGDAHIALALVAVRRGRPGSGALSLREGVLRASWNARLQLLWLAVLAERLGLPPDAEPEVADPVTEAPPIVQVELDALRLRHARLAGQPEPAHDSPAAWSPVAFEEIVGRLARGDVSAAGRRLDELPPAGPSASIVERVERDVARGWFLAAAGDRAGSELHLARALAVAEPEGLIDVFVRAGRPVAGLIEALPGAPDAFRREVVRLAGLVVSTRPDELPDPLTRRELAILAYLPTRLSNAEIAARGYVSLNTVKTHIARIYRKLDVQSRAAAVDRAAELGLLEPLDLVDER
ncbi:LuxR family maltose regulon positive regulatory protein [Leifsonia sp. 563]|uniref:LuxR C-terminal-related transcriptional regulator n=1 Tax=Leifsonia sp. 563 TaxID=3156412 RepID=UPI00339090FE